MKNYMKKELKKHKNSNIIEADLRNLTRNIFRRQPTDMILEKKNGEGVKVEGLEVTPEFAAITEKVMKERAAKNERLKAMLEMTEIWTPPTATLEEQSVNKKKHSSFVNDISNDDTKTKIVKPRKQRKKQSKLEEQSVNNKKPSSFVNDISNDDTKTKIVKPRKQRKKKRKLEVTFIADKKLGLDVIFESDIKMDEQDD